MIFQPQRGMQEVSYIWYRAPSTLYMGKGTSVWDLIIKFEIFHFLGTLRYDGCTDNLFSHSFYQNNIIECEYLQKYLIHFFLKQHISLSLLTHQSLPMPTKEMHFLKKVLGYYRSLFLCLVTYTFMDGMHFLGFYLYSGSLNGMDTIGQSHYQQVPVVKVAGR